MIRAAVVSLVLVATANAQTVQRQEFSVLQGTTSGSGQVLEMSAGQTVDEPVSGGGIIYAGYLNTNHAPGTVTDLSAVTASTEATVLTTWTEVGGDGMLGQAASLIIKVATYPITTQALFESASTYAVLTPAASGGFESQTESILMPGPNYYFAVEARDAAKNQGALSNLVSTNTFATPPADITSLAAAASGAGAAQLTWLSPGDNGNTGTLNPGQFRIEYSTAASPAFAFDQYQLLIATIATPGTAQSTLLTGLLGNATYSFNIFTGDHLPVFSGPSNTPQLLTLAYPPAPLAYSGISSTTFTANWGLNNDTPGTQFFVQVASDALYTIPVTTQDFTATTSAVFSGLATETTYYVRVKAQNGASVQTAFVDLGPVFLPIGIKAATGISVASANHALNLQWNPVLSGLPTGTNIYRSVSAVGPFVKVTTLPITTVTYNDAGLSNGVTYYYRLTSFKSGAESPPSSVFTGIPRDAVGPQGVAGIMGALQAPVFTLTWMANPFKSDGSPLTELRQYDVYRSSALNATPLAIGIVPANAPLQFSDPQGATLAPQYYFVRAEDASGNRSIESLWVQSPSASTPLSLYSVAPDRSAVSQIPESGVTGLGNDSVVLLWTRHPQDENGRVALSYTIEPLHSDGAKVDSNYSLPLHTQFTFHYVVPGGAGPLAANAVFRPGDLSVFVFNGVEYVKIGGTVDPVNRTISVESRVTGKYLVKQSLRAQAFTILQTVPRKIFTPNGDGVNDTFQIFFDNPQSSVISQAKVYDITGAEVADLQLGPTGDSLAWNGRDHGGRVAHTGIYIYQIQAEGKTYNGTVVLAK